MGIVGTAIAKESCNLVLSKDDIRGVVHGINNLYFLIN